MKVNVRVKIVLITAAILCFSLGANTIYNSYFFAREYSDALESNAFVLGEGLKLQLDRLLRLGIELENIVGFEEQCQQADESPAERASERVGEDHLPEGEGGHQQILDEEIVPRDVQRCRRVGVGPVHDVHHDQSRKDVEDVGRASDLADSRAEGIPEDQDVQDRVQQRRDQGLVRQDDETVDLAPEQGEEPRHVRPARECGRRLCAGRP